MAIAGWRRSGVSPTPSAGAGSSRVNGNESAPGERIPNSISPVKKTASPPSTAVAHGTSSRRRLRVASRTPEVASDSTQAQSRSEPAWLDHIAVIL